MATDVHVESGRRVDALLAHYAESHRHPSNERIHLICIPAIVFSLLGLLYAAHPWAAYALVIVSLVYYARLSPVILVTMALLTWLSLAVIQSLGPALVPACLVLFIGGWIGQFVGHKIEGRKPTFFEDIQYLLVGPMFCLTFLFRRLGIRW